jgi:hypothetical protein
VFGTHNPQLPAGNVLALECDGTHTPLAITPTFWIDALRHFASGMRATAAP